MAFIIQRKAKSFKSEEQHLRTVIRASAEASTRQRAKAGHPMPSLPVFKFKGDQDEDNTGAKKDKAT